VHLQLSKQQNIHFFEYNLLLNVLQSVSNSCLLYYFVSFPLGLVLVSHVFTVYLCYLYTCYVCCFVSINTCLGYSQKHLQYCRTSMSESNERVCHFVLDMIRCRDQYGSDKCILDRDEICQIIKFLAAG